MNATLDDFEVLSTTYKTISNVPINADVLVPRNITAGLHPCIFRFHGGGFVSGSTLYPGFFPNWMLELSLVVGAIIVLPNYRLLPESNVPDILADMDDFWQWTRHDLQALLDTSSTTARGLRADLSHVLTVGESAGAYLSAQVALSHARHGGVRACIAECGAFSVAGMGGKNGTGPINKPAIRPDLGPPVVADPTLSRFSLVNKLVADGTFTDYFGDDVSVDPIWRLEEEVGVRMPPTFLIHGLDDDVLGHENSVEFKEAVLRADPGAEVHLELRPGGHLFDVPLHLGHAWLVEVVRLVLRAWL